MATPCSLREIAFLLGALGACAGPAAAVDGPNPNATDDPLAGLTPAQVTQFQTG